VPQSPEVESGSAEVVDKTTSVDDELPHAPGPDETPALARWWRRSTTRTSVWLWPALAVCLTALLGSFDSILLVATWLALLATWAASTLTHIAIAPTKYARSLARVVGLVIGAITLTVLAHVGNPIDAPTDTPAPSPSPSPSPTPGPPPSTP
jgi:hypothetical protein